jgi:SAM-dependent methyltransferase
MLKPSVRKGSFYFPLHAHSLPRVLKFEHFYRYFLSLPAGGTVLDYGSGIQPYKEMLLTRFERYIAADLKDAVGSHACRPDTYVTATAVDQPSASVDCVVLTEVLEHLYEPRETLLELHRLLRPGGRLLGTVPFFMSEHEQPRDYHRYTSFCLERMFAESGYRIVEIEYVGDMIGVAITGSVKVLQLAVKALRILRLGPLAELVNFAIRLPEYGYYGMLRLGLNPQRVAYFKQHPLGFTFHLEKPFESDSE